MPRKPGDVTPHGAEVHMDEETGRRLYGGSGSHQGPGGIASPEEEAEGRAERQTNAPSRAGKGKLSHHPRST